MLSTWQRWSRRSRIAVAGTSSPASTWGEYISPDGRVIVGEGVNQSGDLRAWIAIIPEPSTGLLLGAGLIILSLCGRVVIPIEPLREWLLTRTEAEKAAADQVAQQILDELGR